MIYIEVPINAPRKSNMPITKRKDFISTSQPELLFHCGKFVKSLLAGEIFKVIRTLNDVSIGNGLVRMPTFHLKISLRCKITISIQNKL